MGSARPTLRAYLKHFRGPVRRFWVALSRTPWPFISFLLRLTHQRRAVRNEESRVNTAYVLHSPVPEPSVRGQDITDGIVAWLSEVLDSKSIIIVFSLDEIEALKPDPQRSVILPTNDWLAPFARQPLHRQFREAVRMKKTGLPVWGMLPDLFNFKNTLATSILVSLTGGAHPMSCNSVQSAKRFGIPNPVGHFFWALPELPQRFRTVPRWSAKKLSALASMSGERRRQRVLKPLVPKVEAAGYTFNVSHSSKVPYERYLKLLETSRVVLAPTFLQQFFIGGPIFYQNRLSQSILTGRVWETFASGCALLTNYNQDLEDLGFNMGIHYLELPVEAQDIEPWSWPEDKILKSVAHAGREHYLQLVAEERNQRLYIS